jgi:hypothetical protein
VSRLRAAIQFVVFAIGEAALVAGRGWSVGDLAAAALTAFGLLELLVAARAIVQDNASWKTLAAGLGAGGLLITGLLLASSWRWVAVGAWPVVIVVLFSTFWPERASEDRA